MTGQASHEHRKKDSSSSQSCDDEPNSLNTLHWPANVLLFHPPPLDTDDETKAEHSREIQRQIEPTQDPTTLNPFSKSADDDKLTFTSDKHFSPHHYALLFAPGEYPNCSFEVGYYVQMLGLGVNAQDVQFSTLDTTEKNKESSSSSGPFVPALNKHLSAEEYATIPYDGAGICLDTFWRSAENFSIVGSSVVWAVSQAAPLRRVDIQGGDLKFGDGGGAYASGGVLANARVDGGMVEYQTQQQFYTRNVEFGSGKDGERGYSGGAWNLTFSGCTSTTATAAAADGARVPLDANGQDSENPDLVYSSEPVPRVRMEKPFISLENGDRWYLRVPKSTRHPDQVVGPQLNEQTAGERRDFCRVKVVAPRPVEDKDVLDADAYNSLDDIDDAITQIIQIALDEGKDVVLCPGTFFLTKALIVKSSNQVILGLGLATLVSPQDGSPCIRVKSNIPGVRIAGLTLEASSQKRLKGPQSLMSRLQSIFFQNPNQRQNGDGVRSLLEFGEPDIFDPGNPENPGLLSDIFCRVGGMNLERVQVQTDVMIRIHSGHVIGDNLWLWRADHVQLDSRNKEKPNDPKLPLYHQTRRNDRAGVYECAVDTALEVRGDNVTMYGLFCEHTLKDQLIWKGNHGVVTFYQCELPYDVQHNHFKDHVGYKVGDSVHHHTARGIGVYSNFQVDDIRAKAGIWSPGRPKIYIMNPFTIFLDGRTGSQIDAVATERDDGTGEESSMGDPVTASTKGIPSRPR